MNLIIYHQVRPGTDCPDGIAAAAIMAKRFPKSNIRGWCYDQAPPTVQELKGYDHVFIVDFRFDRKTLESWRSHGINFTVIDHHKTAIQELSGLSEAILDQSECGATMAWRYCFPDLPLPHWLKYVRDRDLWRHKLPFSKEIHEAISANGRSLAQIEGYLSLSYDQLLNLFVDKGSKLLESKRQKIAIYAATAEPIPIGEINFMLVNLPPSDGRLASELAEELYTNPSNPNQAIVAVSEGGKWVLHLRSWNQTDNEYDPQAVDVSAIATHCFDGGGHYHAAGAVIPSSMLWEDLVNYLITLGCTP